MSQTMYSSPYEQNALPVYVPYNPSNPQFPPPPQRSPTPQYLPPTSTSFSPPPQRTPTPQYLPPPQYTSSPQFAPPPPRIPSLQFPTQFQFAAPPQATDPYSQAQPQCIYQTQQPYAPPSSPGRPRTLARLVSSGRELVTNALQDPNTVTADGTPKPIWDTKKTQKVVNGFATSLKYCASFAHAANDPTAPALGMLNNFVQGKVQRSAERAALAAEQMPIAEPQVVVQQERSSISQAVTTVEPAPIPAQSSAPDQLAAFLTLMYLQQQQQQQPTVEVEDPPEVDLATLKAAEDPVEAPISELSVNIVPKQASNPPVARSTPVPEAPKVSKAEKYGKQTFQVLECLASLAAVSNLNGNACPTTTTNSITNTSASGISLLNFAAGSSPPIAKTSTPSPRNSDSAATTALAGSYKHISSGSGWSEENSYTLAPNGRFAFNLRTSVSASSFDQRVSGYAYDANNPTGAWNTQGDANSGTLTLNHDDGGMETRSYQRQDDGKFFVGGKRWYRTG